MSATVGKTYKVWHECRSYPKNESPVIQEAAWRVGKCTEVHNDAIAYFQCECRAVVGAHNNLIFDEAEPVAS